MKNLFDVKGKVVVLTGGCGVLGQCIARYLAEQGSHGHPGYSTGQ